MESLPFDKLFALPERFQEMEGIEKGKGKKGNEGREKMG